MGTEIELLKDTHEFQSTLKNAKTQIECLMMTDVSCFKISIQKEIQAQKKKQNENRNIEKHPPSEKMKNTLLSKSLNNFFSSPQQQRKNSFEEKDNTNKLMSYLAKNKKISLWFFWKDLRELIEGDVQKNNFAKLRELNVKYFYSKNIVIIFF